MKTEEIILKNKGRIFKDMANERWYPLKGNDPESMKIVDIYPEYVEDGSPFLVKLRSEDAGMAINLLLNPTDSKNEVEDSIRSGKVVVMIKKLLEGRSDQAMRFTGNSDEIIRNLNPYHAFNGNQSNSSFIMNGEVIGKFFRAFSDIDNPDYTIPLSLWKKTGFRNTPEPLGMITYQEKECLMAFSRYVPNRGDYWSYLNNIPEDQNFAEILLGSAENIARITARMHNALSKIGDESFEKEPFNSTDIQLLKDSYASYEESVAEICRNSSRSGMFGEIYRGLPVIREAGSVFGKLKEEGFFKQRIHGDFHLGQILNAEQGPQIIDFEGEPMRSIQEKSAKQCTMKDIAGLIRSYDYLCRGRMKDPDRLSRMLENTILSTYTDEMAHLDPGFGERIQAFSSVLRVFILEKALYETIYEHRNRPGWIHIPLGFILSFIKDQKSK